MKMMLFVLLFCFSLITPNQARAILPKAHLAPSNIVGAVSPDQGKLFYKEGKGTTLEFNDFDMRLNLQIQTRVDYNDNDQADGRPDGEDDEDSIDMRVRRVRFTLSGNTLNKQFSYKVQNDFVGGKQPDGRRGSDLKDAWLQLNTDDAAKLRMGQFKRPYSLQENVSSSSLQFIDRARIIDTFIADDRHMGSMLHGALGEGIEYAAGVFNGESDGEGRNLSGVDNNIQGAAQITADLVGEYGGRGFEGDLRTNNTAFAMNAGTAVMYGQGSTEVGDGVSDFDKVDVNADIGMRYDGWSGQGEFFFRSTDLDSIAGDSGEGDDIGFYVQTGYFVVPREWEVAFRFGYTEPDDAFVGNDLDGNFIDDQQEYTLGLNYFLNGHNLKVQANVSLLNTNYQSNFGEDDETSDVVYSLQLAGLV